MYHWHPFQLSAFPFIILLHGDKCGNSAGKKKGSWGSVSRNVRAAKAPADPHVHGCVVTYLTPWNLIISILLLRKIPDHPHHLVLLLFIYSCIITKPSGLSHTRTHLRLCRFHTDTAPDWCATINLTHIPVLPYDTAGICAQGEVKIIPPKKHQHHQRTFLWDYISWSTI